MLERADIEVSAVLSVFNKYNAESCLLVPTETGMAKSIMDATSTVREYLRKNLIHDYESQRQGPDSKVVKKIFFVELDGYRETTVSLYRPETKKGDPRIWISGLKSYAKPFNLIALIAIDGCLYAINCSQRELLASAGTPNSPLNLLLRKFGPLQDPAVVELIDLLRDIRLRGYIKTMRAGDTGIGYTLESLLGISANSSKSPDFKGIEIKATRFKKSNSSRVTLFSQAPNWKLSPIGSAWNLLKDYGYFSDGKLRFNHEINAKAPNSKGFYLDIDSHKDWLQQKYLDKISNVKKHLVTWEMSLLRTRLLEKHPQTFWVKAHCRGSGVDEHFEYIEIEHTRSPSVQNFDMLLEAGAISVDYLMSQFAPHKERVRDHGYLFKMHSSDFSALFPASQIYEL